MTTLKKILKSLLNRVPYARFNKYPYIHAVNLPSISEKPVKFLINNSIEEFRIVSWGDEKEYILSMIQEVDQDDIFLDIGSSVGLVSILAGSKASKGLVISIEPDPENFKCLNENYKFNSLKNYKALQIAIGDEKNIMKLYTTGANGLSPSLQKINGIDNTIEVNVETVDNLIQNGTIPMPTIIKIDIEGAEMMALKGMKNTLKANNKPRIIFIEIHPPFLPSFNTSSSEVIQFLSDLDYTITEKIERDEQLLCKLELIK